jgi:hypothetical protein
MTDDTTPTRDAHEAAETPAAADSAPTAAPLTSEQRLRALAGDRKRKARKGSRPAAGTDTALRPGDIVDAVRERNDRDRGRDQPL